MIDEISTFVGGEQRKRQHTGTDGRERVNQSKQRGYDHGQQRPLPIPPPPIPTPRRVAAEMISAAEQRKANAVEIPGKDNGFMGEYGGELVHSVMVDEEYSAIASHIDEVMHKKTMLGDYVDFVKLIPRDRVLLKEDQRMEMVNRGGLSYWVPVGDRSSTIGIVHHWDQAFRVFSKIYLEYHPGRASELIQYSPYHT